MAAWETESRSWGGLIQPLSSHAKRVLCLDAIGLCLTWFRPAPGEGPAARLARRVLDRLRRQVDDFSDKPYEEFLDDLRALRESDDCPAVASIVTALTQYADAVPVGLDAADVFMVMSASYEAVLHAERGNQTLAHLIIAQRDLIEAVALA